MKNEKWKMENNFVKKRLYFYFKKDFFLNG